MSEKTLPERMREAADTLREANTRRGRQGYDDTWTPGGLDGVADSWERADEASKFEADLATSILVASKNPFGNSTWVARELLRHYDISRKPELM